MATRLHEQTERILGVCSPAPLYPRNATDLEELEKDVQKMARNLSNHTSIAATSLENLIGELESFASGHQRRVGPWGR
jgi:hypothetical protein